MPLLIVAALAGLIGIFLTVREVHEITEEPAFPLIGIGLAAVAVLFLLREFRKT